MLELKSLEKESKYWFIRIINKILNISTNRNKIMEERKLEQHQERVVVEQKELGEKISKLESFIKSDKFDSVDKRERLNLTCQLDIMKAYWNILDIRIFNF